MSGDRLAQIGRQVRFVHARSPDGNGLVLPNRDVLALVEIAKAARVRLEYGHNDTCDLMLGDSTHPYPCVCGHHELREALARLDSGAAEGDA